MDTHLPGARFQHSSRRLSRAWLASLCGLAMLFARVGRAQSGADRTPRGPITTAARVLTGYRGHLTPPFPTNWIIDSEHAPRSMPNWVVMEGRNRTGSFVATAKRTSNRPDSAGLALEDVILLPGSGRQTPLVRGRCGPISTTGVLTDELIVAVVRKERGTIWRNVLSAWRIDPASGRVRMIRRDGLACTADDWYPGDSTAATAQHSGLR